MFSKISYLKKTMIFYGGVIILLFLSFIVVYVHSQVNNLKGISDSALVQLSEKGASQFEDILDEMNNITLSLATNTNIRTVMKNALLNEGNKNYFESHPQERWKIQKEITGHSSLTFSGKSFNVITKDYDELSLNIYETKEISREIIEEISWVRDILENKKNKHIASVGVDQYGRTDEETFSFVRGIQDEYYRYGLIEVQYEKTYLNQIFDINMQGNEMETIIISEGMEIFFNTDNAPVGEISTLDNLSKNQSKNEMFAEVELEGIKYTVYRIPLNQYDMQVFTLINMEDYLKPVKDAFITVLIFAGLLLPLILIFLYTVSNHLNRPISQLRDQIENIDYTNLEIDYKPDSTNNEIILLKYAFETMLENMKKATGELVESKTREIKAEYKVLQVQVNPHFIHNILAVIGLMGYQAGEPQIMDMCSQLTKMLRYNTETATTHVPIASEIEHVEMYLKLMKYRYMDQLKYEILIEPDLKDQMVPKFILQPIVENCFQHSFNNSAASCYLIHIKGSLMEDGWIITIDDNGSGFTEEKVLQLYEQFDKIKNKLEQKITLPDMQIGQMALINTYARLFLYADGKIEIKLEKSPIGGSRVIIIYKGGSQ